MEKSPLEARRPSGRVRNVAQELLSHFVLAGCEESRLSLVGNRILARLVASWPKFGVKWLPEEPSADFFKVDDSLTAVVVSDVVDVATDEVVGTPVEFVMDGEEEEAVPFLVREGGLFFWDIDALYMASEQERWDWLWRFTEYVPHQIARAIGTTVPGILRLINQAKALRLIMPDGTTTDDVKDAIQGILLRFNPLVET